jgi:uncharacterized membrane protein
MADIQALGEHRPMHRLAKRARLVALSFLGIIILLGLILRLDGVTEHTMTHIEISKPGIKLPSEISAPQARLNVSQTLYSLLYEQEPHPPGYYLLMLGWTKLFGTSLLALRLPSILFGVGSILLIYLLGTLERDRTTALAAAALLALNGYHIHWSQIAKNYVPACFLGLLSTVLLLVACWRGARQRLYVLAYVAVTWLGFTTTIWFWPIFITHILWVVRVRWTNRGVPGLFRWQILTLILGTPLLSLAVFQARRASYIAIEQSLWEGLSSYFELGILFEPDRLTPKSSFLTLVAILAIIVTVFLLSIGPRQKHEGERHFEIIAGPPQVALFGASALAILAILGFAQYCRQFGPSRLRLAAVVASILAPLLLPIADLLARRYWSQLQDWAMCLGKRLPLHWIPSEPSSWLAILPVVGLTAAWPVAPLVASRGTLLYVPYLLHFCQLVSSNGFTGFLLP